jgi:hypothetical protein
MTQILITEEQLRTIVKEATLGDDILNLRVGNIAKGAKGFWRGEGYEYFSFLNTLKGIIKKLDKVDKPNETIIKELLNLRNSLSGSKISQSKKNAITSAIDLAINHFNAYRTIVDKLIVKLEKKLDQ